MGGLHPLDTDDVKKGESLTIYSYVCYDATRICGQGYKSDESEDKEKTIMILIK